MIWNSRRPLPSNMQRGWVNGKPIHSVGSQHPTLATESTRASIWRRSFQSTARCAPLFALVVQPPSRGLSDETMAVIRLMKQSIRSSRK
jgi:hypothetical protein